MLFYALWSKKSHFSQLTQTSYHITWSSWPIMHYFVPYVYLFKDFIVVSDLYLKLFSLLLLSFDCLYTNLLFMQYSFTKTQLWLIRTYFKIRIFIPKWNRHGKFDAFMKYQNNFTLNTFHLRWSHTTFWPRMHFLCHILMVVLYYFIYL